MATTLNIEKVDVQFPFTPYDCQKDYMSSVIQCLKGGTNAILESPTGTGKTLCLLCATLAWRDHFKDKISIEKIKQKQGGEAVLKSLNQWGEGSGDTSTTFYSDLPRIIYASRTHSQLSQVIHELKNTAYRPKMCVLGSRDQMCIHPEVMRQESSHIKIHMCRAKISNRSCKFYNTVDEKSTDEGLVNSIMDIEDLVKFGMKQSSCPYYLARNLKQNAEIIFTPYNYLLDPKSRRAHNIELKGSVVIFDEAHNLEKMCEESTSFDLTPYDVASAIDAVDKLLVEKVEEEKASGVTETFNAENLNSGGLKIAVEDIAKTKEFLLDLEATIDSFEVPDKGITKPGSFIYELFEMAHLNDKTKTERFEALEQITGYLAGRSGIFTNTTGLQKVADIIQLVFPGGPEDGAKGKDMLPSLHASNSKGDPQAGRKGNDMKSNIVMFKVHIHKDNSFQKKKQPVDIWSASSSSSSKKQGNVLSYWCFSPGFSMAELTRQGVRSIILTSGTLSPLSSFASEMQIPFPVTLENPHVIEKDQIFVTIIDRGPDGEKLSSAFDRRFVPENMTSLGCTVANLCRVVPHGLLVFFPSYPVMDKTLEFWRANGHAGRIENMKPMFVEPRGKGTFTEVIDGYYNKVKDPTSRGGSFFAVCRGKASEGLDFADTYGRGVVITGMPFPPKMDPRVLLKMQFLDEMSRKKVPGVKYLSGQEWYRQQASRAVNQAIGRVIRHKEDYGAIFLCDQRFKNHDAKAQLPKWVRPYVRQYDNFGHVVRDVAQFFKVAQKLRPFADNKSEVKSCKQVQSAETQPSTSTSFSSSLSRQTQKAKVHDDHVPSLKRRKLNDNGQGTAKLCVQYEADVSMQSYQRKQASLMHALEYSDQPKRDPMHSFVGEENASRLSTQSLQHEKRMMDADLRGGKRKIKLVQERRTGFSGVSDHGKADQAKMFMAEMKKCLCQEKHQLIMQALQNYKKTNDIDELLAKTASLLTEDVDTHSLFRGFYQFIRPQHKKMFDEKCQELTGSGCGYKPDHSLSKEDKESLLQQGDPVGQSGGAGVSSNGSLNARELNTALQLNNGGCHLGMHASGKPVATQAQTVQPVAKKESHSQLLVAELKKVLGVEKCNQLVVAIKNYKDTENYETMVSTVVSLLTERNENFDLLIKFGQFIRPHHKKQYNEMVAALIGGP